MLSHALRVATIVAVALSITAPAFALCNPGTKNCIPAGGPGSRLAAAKNQVFTQPTSGQCDPGPAGICSDDLPGSDARTAPKPGFRPIIGTGVLVK
jgi:hypothetical protein